MLRAIQQRNLLERLRRRKAVATAQVDFNRVEQPAGGAKKQQKLIFCQCRPTSARRNGLSLKQDHHVLDLKLNCFLDQNLVEAY